MPPTATRPQRSRRTTPGRLPRRCCKHRWGCGRASLGPRETETKKNALERAENSSRASPRGVTRRGPTAASYARSAPSSSPNAEERCAGVAARSTRSDRCRGTRERQRISAPGSGLPRLPGSLQKPGLSDAAFSGRDPRFPSEPPAAQAISHLNNFTSRRPPAGVPTPGRGPVRCAPPRQGTQRAGLSLFTSADPEPAC